MVIREYFTFFNQNFCLLQQITEVIFDWSLTFFQPKHLRLCPVQQNSVNTKKR
ncbi:hypothetical protein NC99_04620 [Sunxiuqinia dokdonensis]|uniref:Uncharacterized protein n=1 Tax=Sunxiuqinia dokdonensis TaxID=1409788 RepID=A0A0L8VE65_9BACT|nr:hypothetical protein NC99_04620 [Sunxiuqinia dokdonensis]